MGVFICAQNDSQQQVIMDLGMTLIRMKSFFLHVVRHAQLHLFDSLHSNGCGQAHQGFPKVILNIKTVICED